MFPVRKLYDDHPVGSPLLGKSFYFFRAKQIPSSKAFHNRFYFPDVNMKKQSFGQGNSLLAVTQKLTVHVNRMSEQ